MKRFYLLCITLLLTGGVFANNPEKIDYKKGFITGTPKIESINAIAFGPEGILFLGDSKTASVVSGSGKATFKLLMDFLADCLRNDYLPAPSPVSDWRSPLFLSPKLSESVLSSAILVN